MGFDPNRTNTGNTTREPKARIHSLTARDIKGKYDRGERFFLFDVRHNEEWVQGTIPRAILVDAEDMSRRVMFEVGSFPNPQIVLYCDGGKRSFIVADELARMGYRNVAVLAGGISSWRRINYPVDPPQAFFARN